MDSTFGDARWMEMDELRRDFTGPNGIILGEAYEPMLGGHVFEPAEPKTWGQGGVADLVRMPTGFATGHSLIFAGSNGFKSVGFVMPNALSFGEGLFVVDPKGEIAATAGPVREKAGRRVEVISAFDGLDPVELLAPLWRDEGDTEIFTNIAEWIVGESSDDRQDTAAFFNENCRNMLTGILAYYAYERQKDVIGMAARLFGSDQKTIGALIEEFAARSTNQFVVRVLTPFIGMSEATLSGIIATVYKAIGFANHARVAQFFNGTDRLKRLAAAANGKSEKDPYGRLLEPDVDIYLQIPLETITSHPQLVRVFLGAFAKRYMRQPEGPDQTTRLLIVDEAGRLKRMSLLEVIRDTARSRGLHVMMIYQSLGQLYQHYGQEGARAWFDSAAALSFSCLTDIDNMKKVSALVGTYTARVRSTSTSKRGLVIGGAMSNDMTRGQSESLREVKLISTDELRTMADDEQVLLLRGKNPVRCGKAIYFRRDGWKDLGRTPIRPTTDLKNGDNGGSLVESVQQELDAVFEDHKSQLLDERETRARQESTETKAKNEPATLPEGRKGKRNRPKETGPEDLFSVVQEIGKALGKVPEAKVATINDEWVAARGRAAIREMTGRNNADDVASPGRSTDIDQALGRSWDGRD